MVPCEVNIEDECGLIRLGFEAWRDRQRRNDFTFGICVEFSSENRPHLKCRDELCSISPRSPASCEQSYDQGIELIHYSHVHGREEPAHAEHTANSAPALALFWSYSRHVISSIVWLACAIL